MSSSGPNKRRRARAPQGRAAASKNAIADDAAAAPEKNEHRDTRNRLALCSHRINHLESRTETDYWKSYAHYYIHEQMLKDTIRTNAYREAILKNGHLANKVVLDVGCGTGILSMFAIQAGAAHVYAVDASDIIDSTRAIVDINGYGDRITLIKATMEEAELPVDSVDILISEWMGYCLLYENMLPSVLFARDRYLRPDGGIMLPAEANLYIVGIEDGQAKADHIYFWDDVYGFDMSVMKRPVYMEPIVDPIDPSSMVTDTWRFLSIDLERMKAEDVMQWSSEFRLTAFRKDFVHAFVIFFDVVFSHCDPPIRLSTSPDGDMTHWKQTIFYLHDALAMSQGEAIDVKMHGRFCKDNTRSIEFIIEYKHDGDIFKAQNTQQFRMC